MPSLKIALTKKEKELQTALAQASKRAEVFRIAMRQDRQIEPSLI